MDEADRLLDMDFGPIIDKILKVIPKVRTTFLFCATMTSKVAKLQRASLTNPVRVEVSKKYVEPFVAEDIPDLSFLFQIQNGLNITAILFIYPTSAEGGLSCAHLQLACSKLNHYIHSHCHGLSTGVHDFERSGIRLYTSTWTAQSKCTTRCAC